MAKKIAEKTHRSEQYVTYGMTTATNFTAFRVAERHFRTNPQDTCVIQLASSEENRPQTLPEGVFRYHLEIDPRSQNYSAFGYTTTTKTFHPPAYGFKKVPGLVIIPGFITEAAQKEWILRCMDDYCRPPNKTNLHAHWKLPISSPFSESHQSLFEMAMDPSSCKLESFESNDNPTIFATATHLMNKLRWCTLGYQYDWSTKTYPLESQIPIPDVVHEAVLAIVDAIDGVLPVSEDFLDQNDLSKHIFHYPAHKYKSQAGVINYYGQRESMTAHQDRSERNLAAPLVSFK